MGIFKKTVTSAGTVEFGALDFASDQRLYIRANDSRGFSLMSTKIINFLEYHTPTCLASIRRKNNYEDES